MSKIETIVFDKTGTLTEGVFAVQKVNSIEITEEELLKITAHAENYSSHPIAKSIKKEYIEEINKEIIENYQEHAGLGIEAIIEGKKVLAGNAKLMRKKNINFMECDEVGTIIYVAIEEKYSGYILISDKLKEDSIRTIKELKEKGISKTVMLTGDKKEIGEAIAKKIEIDEVYTELLPDGKVERMNKLIETRNENKKVAFVGDGINDAPVLALADIGIAMGGLGSDAAIESADIVIMTDQPSKILEAIKLSKKTMKIVKENIVFAIFIKILVLILTAIGISSMWQAIFADVGVSIIAIINALRMLNVKK